MQRTFRFIVLTVLAAFVLIVLVRGAKFFSALYAHGKVDENGEQVWNMARTIKAEQPSDASRRSLLIALRRGGLGEWSLYDAWHRPLRVKVWRDQAQQYHYEVMSLGRDDRVGPCSLSRPGCLHNPDGDWIVRDGEFVEIPIAVAKPR